MMNRYVTGHVDNLCEDYSSNYLSTITSIDHENFATFCLPEAYPYDDAPLGNWNGPFSIRRRCLAGRHSHDHVIDYIHKFYDTYNDVPKFLWAAFIEAHEGTGEVIRQVDHSLSQMLYKLQHQHVLDNTMVMFVSDHGLHMGLWWIFQARQAAIENRLPLWIMTIPKWYVPCNITIVILGI